MATTVHEPPKIDLERLPSPGSGNGGWGNLAPADGDQRRVKSSSPPPASTGIWVGLASITMTFAAFTSALVVRQGSARDWQHFSLPSILYLNTLIILLSSVTLEIGRRQIAAFMTAANPASGETRQTAPARWLYITLALGLLFVAGQTVAWLQLRQQGLGLATNISYSFFYVLTVAHALHLLGGLGGMTRVIGKVNHSALRRSTLYATSLYWHFMGALWLYLLILLWIKL
ncbi:MAG: cytochrome c oxidase subunit 3 [Candidatus Sulfotelmatobacter sp.]|jgi:cytochrome c oxidase subunit III